MSVTFRVVRSNKAAPSSSSSLCTAFVIVGGETWSPARAGDEAPGGRDGREVAEVGQLQGNRIGTMKE